MMKLFAIFHALAVQGKLGKVLEKMFYSGEEYVIKRGNRPMAALVPVEAFEALKRQEHSRWHPLMHHTAG
jgi:antitoxin (DNA-binding transcriptional repressor) of toxin-antitoxin stability system